MRGKRGHLLRLLNNNANDAPLKFLVNSAAAFLNIDTLKIESYYFTYIIH